MAFEGLLTDQQPKYQRPIENKDGTQWQFVCKQPYTRKDGMPATLAMWARPCRTCGELFTTLAPLGSRSAHQFEVVNCPTHRHLRGCAESALR